ncbi:hypothetical protein [Caudoviricetes sp.]|nr:hypothetical protein [Caudoviricetes sp.]
MPLHISIEFRLYLYITKVFIIYLLFQIKTMTLRVVTLVVELYT